MLKALSSLTCRVLYGGYGAMLARRGGPKDALAVFRLLMAAETQGLTAELAVAIVTLCAPHRLDPFDVWVLYDQDVGGGLDDAIVKALEMRAFFQQDDPLDSLT